MDAGEPLAAGVDAQTRTARLIERAAAMRVEHAVGVAEMARQILAVGAMAYHMVALTGADIEQRPGNRAALAGKGKIGRWHRPILPPCPPLRKRQFFDLSTSWFLAIHGIIARSSEPTFSIW